MWYMRLGDRLHLAPLKDDIQSALDVATGTGIWALEFVRMFFIFNIYFIDLYQADQYPSCKVIGTDLRFAHFPFYW